MNDDADTLESRSERGRERRSRRLRTVLYVGGAIAAIVVLGLTVAYALRAPELLALLGSKADARPPLAASVTTGGSATAVAPVGRVEVPDLGGMPLAQATTLLQAAGLSASVSVAATLAPSAEQDVAEQSPVAGTVVGTGTVVALRVPAVARGKQAIAPVGHKGPLVIVIDPGHQSRPDTDLEAVGPGATEMQPRATVGSVGVATKIPEYEVDLQIATNLKDRLEASGVRVVMTRTTNDVDLSSAQRAEIANAAKASLYVNIHADSAPDHSSSGVTTLYPAPNQWTKAFAAQSRRAAEAVQGALVQATGATDNGEVAQGDQSAFDWSRVPVVLVDVGNPSNAVEDRLLTSPRYQDQLATGISDGIREYFGREQ